LGNLIKEELGEDFAFDLHSLLVSEFGLNFRHNLAHGLLSPSDFNAPAGIYLWWMLLRLFVIPTSFVQNYSESKSA
jgi:hypothetical protein